MKTFLVTDNQIIDEKMLEDINNILNKGDVANIYGAENIKEMIKNARKDCQERSLEQLPINLFWM